MALLSTLLILKEPGDLRGDDTVGPLFSPTGKKEGLFF
jgi:hypothetical protein